MIYKSIAAGLVAFLTALGCVAMYQREASLISNQAAIAQSFQQYSQQNEAWKQEVAKVLTDLVNSVQEQKNATSKP